jgi:hypothetical protein
MQQWRPAQSAFSSNAPQVYGEELSGFPLLNGARFQEKELMPYERALIFAGALKLS